MIDRYQTKLKQIADKKRKIKSKFDFLYTKKINSLNIKKKKNLIIMIMVLWQMKLKKYFRMQL